MKKAIILLISIFIANVLCAQEQKAIRITKQNSQKEVLIKENKRIIIKTVDDVKFSGRYTVAQDAIIIKDVLIPLADIKYLKRNPLLSTILTTGFFLYSGFFTATMGVALGVLVDPNAFYLIIPAGGLIFAGLQKPNFHRRYKAEKNWTFEIVAIPE
jgi:hypothetical protein